MSKPTPTHTPTPWNPHGETIIVEPTGDGCDYTICDTTGHEIEGVDAVSVQRVLNYHAELIAVLTVTHAALFALADDYPGDGDHPQFEKGGQQFEALESARSLLARLDKETA